MDKGRVLIVDDQEQNRYLVEVLLKGNGYAVHAVGNGAEALEYLRDQPVDLVISDVLMPVMDGFEFCRQVKADVDLRRIPFIVYTATYTGPQDEEFALKIGADRFVQKPCEPDEFMEIVHEVLARRGVAAPIPNSLPEAEVYKLYSERLVRKLEQKMLQLEQETASLRATREALRLSERKYRKLHESMTDGFVYVDMAGCIQESNETYQRMLGYTAEELVSLTYQELTPEKWHSYEAHYVRQVLTRGASDVYEKEYRRKNGSVFPVELRTFLVHDETGHNEGMWAIVRDISERKQAERTQKELEQQLHQAQKLESVGRLAGGVAHDFNNMLCVILNYAKMGLEMTESGSRLHGYLKDIVEAGERSVSIIRHLLAFARKQPIAPQVLDLNEVVESMLKMLRRLIGEDIHLHWQPQSHLWRVKIDPTQIDQILANLCVNARDAIGGVGNITIATGQVYLDAGRCARHGGAVPGEYAVLSVRDDGCGLEKEMLDKIFEPFFTTKEPGQGTGLGLATVYGIVKQNSGIVEVDSEPGCGAIFSIYLPRHADPPEKMERQAATDAIQHGQGETILVVEDEAAILKMTVTILEELGYRVLGAGSPSRAIELADAEAGDIDLLLTDVIMPELNGLELAERLRRLRPRLKCLFMSGYPASAINNNGFIDKPLRLLQKPFSIPVLARHVREALAA